MFNSILLHIPHSSLYIPDGSIELTESLNEVILKQTDLLTDKLFLPTSFEDERIKSIVFPYNRYYCDVERYSTDSMERNVVYGQGFYYTHDCFGNPFKRFDSKIEIKEKIYNEHHNKLNSISKDLIKKYGSCLIIDCHSFNDFWLPIDGNWNNNKRQDICFGVEGVDCGRCGRTILNGKNDVKTKDFERITKHFHNADYTFEINNPYAGSMYPSEYKHGKLKTIMLEINKKLYLDNETGFNKVKNVIEELYKTILKTN